MGEANSRGLCYHREPRRVDGCEARWRYRDEGGAVGPRDEGGAMASRDEGGAMAPAPRCRVTTASPDPGLARPAL
jgi:hypothetical protein